MTKRQTVHSALFVGTCALGAALFMGGYHLRGRTDALARIAKTRSTSSEGYTASLTDQAQIPLSDFYSAMTDLLKKEYVEPIKDDQKLATGAVRGMILSLGDPRCVFMDKDEYRAFLNAREGRYEGIGIEVGFQGFTPKAVKPSASDPSKATPPDDPHEAVLASRVPDVVVTMVVPGGPADRAGVKVGDVASDIDGHWVVDDAEIARFNRARADFVAKKIPFATVSKIQSDLRKKVERSLMPGKAKDRLILGATGTVNVVWRRAVATRKTKITKGESQTSPFAVKDGAYVMRFDRETPGRLRTAIKDKTSVTLDLRNNVDGDYDSMRQTLAVLAPKGTYGAVVNMRKDAPTALTVTNGNANPPKITIRVDRTTQGPAAILARALVSRRLATLVGGSTGSDFSVREVFSLPDGTGYTLVTGEYRPDAAGTKVALKEDPS